MQSALVSKCCIARPACKPCSTIQVSATGSLSIRLIAAAIAVALTLAVGSTAEAQNRAKSGSSNRTFRAEAVRSIPFSQMNKAAGQRIQRVVRNPSFYRRLPVESINVDKDHFRFLVRKPEVIVSIWQLMGVTQMTAERTAPYSVKTNDGAGTISDLELVYGNDDMHIFYGTGSYTGSLIKQKLTGRCVIVLQTREQNSSAGTSLTNQLDIFLKVDNAAAALVTRTIQPLVGTTADHNFVESLKFVQRLNDSTKSNGPGVKEMGKRLRIEDSVRKEYFAVIDSVFEKEFQRKYGSRPNSTSLKRTTASNASTASTRERRSMAPTARLLKSTGQPPASIQPATSLKRRVSVDNPASHFSADHFSADRSAIQSRRPTTSLNGFSVLVGGPRPSLHDARSSVASSPVNAAKRMDRLSGPVARSARELPPIIAGPKINPSVFQRVGNGRYIPVHKVPR